MSSWDKYIIGMLFGGLSSNLLLGNNLTAFLVAVLFTGILIDYFEKNVSDRKDGGE